MYERNLERIRIKVRRYVGRLSEERIEDEQLNYYIFEVMRYDLAEDLSFTKIKTTWDLITTPNIGVYDLTKIQIPDPSGDDMVRVINLYEDFMPKAELNGSCLSWKRDQCDFHISSRQCEKKTIKGTGTQGPYTFDLNAPILQGSTYLYLNSRYNDPIIYVDKPLNRNLGTFSNTKAIETIDSYIYYVEGKAQITFKDAVSEDSTISVLCKSYRAGKPSSIFFDGRVFYLNPIPDDIYVITIACYKNPIRLLLDNDSPEVDKWSDYIALGAAKRIFRESDNHDAKQRFAQDLREEQNKNIYREDQQYKARRINSRNIYNDAGSCNASGCGEDCNTGSSCLPKYPFNKGGCC